ncbi:phosphoheptose isomerase [Fodinibius sp.]|uniref:phosphoheptose isomerase n=1 Tax=Fodinibius sp. TaxID=1872440 RepID=UPI002ACD3840|nr:phosphoheptose isomerase [Fodinibius sp.]MDZ7657946.1 phosphoheptose isomerase [Fodinibius sp.]
MSSKRTKKEIFDKTKEYIEKKGFTIVDQDYERPWGGFFVIDEDQAPQFGKTFFGDQDIEDLRISGKLSPKILVVQPQKRLSWQYHHRRAEIWRVLEGPVGVMTSDTDEQGSVDTLQAGEYVKLKQGERHRLVGLDDWGILAEIWQHTDPDNPSDEDDIVRVQDDFGR